MNVPEEIIHEGRRYVLADRIATRVSCYAMYDAHCFHKLEGKTVDEIIAAWKHKCEHDPDPQYGPPDMLCSIIVLEDKKELRRVGRMVHGTNDTKNLGEWRAACLADADIVRCLAESSDNGSGD